MDITLLFHILAGSLSLVAGYIALYSAKGGTLHRRSGMAFVYTMLPMTLLGIVLASTRNAAPELNIPAGLITAYLVVTSLATVKPVASPEAGRALAVGGLLVALGVGTVMLLFGFEAIAAGGSRKGMPAFPFFLFALFGLSGAAGDLRMLQSGPPAGRPKIARHLWRMTSALFIAAMSFFLGQAKVIPEPIRIMPLLMLPILAVFVTLIYWMWRMRPRHPRSSHQDDPRRRAVSAGARPDEVDSGRRHPA